MKITDRISFIGLNLLFERILVIADPHIGLEEALHRRGVLLPSTQSAELVKEISKVPKNSYDEVVIAGDLKHEFGTILSQEWKDITTLLDFFGSKNITAVKGNHDILLDPVLKKRGLNVVPWVKRKEVLITHGDREPDNLKGVKTIIMGHEHPAIRISDGPRSEIFKAFIMTTYKRRRLIVMPSINPLIGGSDFLTSRHMSPLLKNKPARVFVVEDKVYDFGTLPRQLP
jgi:hypothetical protein